MRVQAIWRISLAMAGLTTLLISPCIAGEICMQWSPVQGASGYRVYYGLSSGNYSHSVNVGNVTEVDLGGFSDCTTYFLAVKAYNAAGESDQYSNEITGWARPEIASMAPAAVAQGSQVTLNISGANFDSGSELRFDTANVPTDSMGNALIRLENISRISCNEFQALLTVEPTARGIRAMEIGGFEAYFSVVNPDEVFGEATENWEIIFDQFRSDINRSDSTTTDRVDGKDLVWLAHAYGSLDGEVYYNPDADLDGDGQVDGTDLAYLAASFGMCWNGSIWSNAACP
jgi:hypothetical protein